MLKRPVAGCSAFHLRGHSKNDISARTAHNWYIVFINSIKESPAL